MQVKEPAPSQLIQFETSFSPPPSSTVTLPLPTHNLHFSVPPTNYFLSLMFIDSFYHQMLYTNPTKMLTKTRERERERERIDSLTSSGTVTWKTRLSILSLSLRSCVKTETVITHQCITHKHYQNCNFHESFQQSESDLTEKEIRRTHGIVDLCLVEHRDSDS